MDAKNNITIKTDAITEILCLFENLSYSLLVQNTIRCFKFKNIVINMFHYDFKKYLVFKACVNV